MIIDTQKTSIRIQLQKLLFLVILVVFLVLLYTLEMFYTPFLGIERSVFAFIATGMFVAGYTFSYLRDANYFYFNNNSSKLIIRYYSLRPLSSEQNSLEMLKSDFLKFEITKKLWGLQKFLIIYKRSGQSAAKYPPISISILKRKELERLVLELTAIH